LPLPIARCPGHGIDLIDARKAGGAGEPGQTAKDTKAEDVWE